MAQEDVVAGLVGDHQEVERLFARLGSDTDVRAEQRRTTVDQVIMELVRHAVAEEAYLWPTVRARVPGGGALADQELTRQRRAEELMRSLDSLDPADAEFTTVLDQLMAVVREHVDHEEHEVFPRLADACTDQQLAVLGEKVRRIKRIAPTRPHPSAPEQPPMVAASTDGDADLVDRMRGLLTGRGHTRR